MGEVDWRPALRLLREAAVNKSPLTLTYEQVLGLGNLLADMLESLDAYKAQIDAATKDPRP